jgi:hypothetical protein
VGCRAAAAAAADDDDDGVIIFWALWGNSHECLRC